MHAQQSYLFTCLPILAKQSPDILENLSVKLSRRRQRMRPSDGREVFETQFKLEGPRMEMGLTQASTNHLGKTDEGRLQALRVSGVFVVSMLMADGFRVGISAVFRVEPS